MSLLKKILRPVVMVVISAAIAAFILWLFSASGLQFLIVAAVGFAVSIVLTLAFIGLIFFLEWILED